jgi:hypothetical protein
MKGIVISCPVKSCQKLLLKNAYLRTGTFLTMRCFSCGTTIMINSLQGKIELTVDKLGIIDKSPDNTGFDDDDEDGIMFISI